MSSSTIVLLLLAVTTVVTGQNDYPDWSTPTPPSSGYPMPPKPKQNDWIPLNDYAYYHNLDAKSWWDAQEWCMGNGGSLASIHSNQENFVVNYIIQSSVQKFCLQDTVNDAWIGAFNDNDTLVWSDRTNLTFQHVDMTTDGRKCGATCVKFQSQDHGLPTGRYSLQKVGTWYERRRQGQRFGTPTEPYLPGTATKDKDCAENLKNKKYWRVGRCLDKLAFVCKKKIIL